MLAPVRSSQFKRDLKRVQKRGKDMTKLRDLLTLLIGANPGRPPSSTSGCVL
jgi:mRNA interferase YafQ